MSVRRILIIGAGHAGRALAREYQHNGSEVMVAGFLDDDPAKLGSHFDGVPVLGNLVVLEEVIGEAGIDEVLVAMPSARYGVARGVVRRLMKAAPRVTIHIVPEAEKYFDDVPIRPSLHDITLSELLDRDEEEIDVASIRHFLEGKRVLVTGAGGSIGSEISRQLLKFNIASLIALGRGEHSLYMLARSLADFTGAMDSPPPVYYRVGDVRNGPAMERLFAEYTPQVVIHAAAHKHVPLMEYNVAEAVSNNVLGTKNLLHVASRFDVEKFILVSTDKAVRPTSVMGATKRIAEMLTTAAASESMKTAVVRFGNVIGSRGSVVPLFREQIAAGGPVTVTHPEMKRFFMTIPEASLLVLNAAAYAHRGELFLLKMGEQYPLVEIARRCIRLAGFSEKEIPVEFTGLRPGEKLEEELWQRDRSVHPTSNNAILRVEEPPGDAELLTALEGLEPFTMEKEELMRLLQNLVTDFSPGDESGGVRYRLVNGTF